MTATIAPPPAVEHARDAVQPPRMLRNSLTMAWRAALRIRREPLASAVLTAVSGPLTMRL